MTLYILLAIAISIILGYKTQINIGFFAIIFAYLIGCFGMGMKVGDVIELWPIKIFFVIFAVTLFYNFALANGALEKLASQLLHKCRRFPQMLPLALFFVATIIAALGAGYYTVLAFMAPITLLSCQKTKMNPIIAVMAVNYGCLGGANLTTSQSGVIFRGLMEGVGVSNANAFNYASGIFVVTMVIPVLVLGAYILFNRKNSQIVIDSVQPEPLNAKQKQSMMLIYIMMAIVLIFPILNLFMPHNETIKFLNSRVDIGFLAIFFALISLFLKLGDEKKVVSLIPWGTLIMIAGVGMLTSLGIKAGVIKELSEWLVTNVPMWLLPILLCFISATMALFASTLGVVTPALFPIVPALAVSTGLNPFLLFTSIVIGAQSAAISPFNSGGSLILGSAPIEMDKNTFFKGLLFRAVPIGTGAALLATLIMQFVL